MEIIDFKKLKVTTMTVIVNLTGFVTIEKSFPLLPITRLNIPDRIKHKKNFKIPYCKVPGAILSVKYQGNGRGLVKKSNNKKYFRNSVTINICTSVKNVSAKLSKAKIQMCGVNSKELALETAHNIINHLFKIQDDLDYIHENEDEMNKTIEWIKHHTLGKEYIINQETEDIIELQTNEYVGDDMIVYKKNENGIDTPKYYYRKQPFYWKVGDYINDNVIYNKYDMPYYKSLKKSQQKRGITEPEKMVVGKNVMILDSESDDIFDITGDTLYEIIKIPLKVIKINSIILPTEYPNNYPDHIIPRIANFFIKYAPDFTYHNVYCEFLDAVKHIKEITDRNLKVDSINMAMINYSYSLNMTINRWKLAESINGLNGFQARYNNRTDHCVTVTIPYEIHETDNDTKRKTKKAPCHTFMIYKSGIVTQSGPRKDLMEDVYYKFMNTINEIKSYISIDSFSN